jgi:hypothetical protein
MTSVNIHDKSSFVHSHDNGSNTVTEYLVFNNIFTEHSPKLVRRCKISYASKLAFNIAANFHFVRPKKAIGGKLPSCPGSRPTLTENSVVLSYLMQKC